MATGGGMLGTLPLHCVGKGPTLTVWRWGRWQKSAGKMFWYAAHGHRVAPQCAGLAISALAGVACAECAPAVPLLVFERERKPASVKRACVLNRGDAGVLRGARGCARCCCEPLCRWAAGDRSETRKRRRRALVIASTCRRARGTGARPARAPSNRLQPCSPAHAMCARVERSPVPKARHRAHSLCAPLPPSLRPSLASAFPPAGAAGPLALPAAAATACRSSKLRRLSAGR
jgi:hypothetical protein